MKGEEGNKAGSLSSSQPCQLCAVRQELAEWVFPDMWKHHFPFATS